MIDFSGKIHLLQRKGVIDDNDSEVDDTFILLCTYDRELRYSERSDIAENRLIGDGDDDE